MDKIQMAYQRHETSYFVGLTLAQVAKAMWAAWKSLKGTETSKQVRVDFGVNTDDKLDIHDHHGIILQSPFDSLMLITNCYGGYDFEAVELNEARDELSYGLEWQEDYPDMTRSEAVLLKSLEKVIWNEWRDENGLLWCDCKDCIEAFMRTIPNEEVIIITQKS